MRVQAQIMGRLRAADAVEWENIVSEQIVPLRLSRTGDSFAARFESHALASQVSVFKLATGPALVERTSALAKHADTDDVFLAVQTHSAGFLHQNGRSAEMVPGSASVFDPLNPYAFDHRLGRQKQVTLRIGRGLLGLRQAQIDELAATLIRRDDPRLRMLSTFVLSLWDDIELMDGDMRAELGEVATKMASQLLRADGRAERSATGPMHDKLTRYIRQNQSDPEVSVATVARAHHLSIRSVYDAFANADTTPAHYLRNQRLARAATILSRPSTSTLAEVATECGFLDAATFSRAFKRRYQLSPGRYRREYGRL